MHMNVNIPAVGGGGRSRGWLWNIVDEHPHVHVYTGNVALWLPKAADELGS